MGRTIAAVEGSCTVSQARAKVAQAVLGDAWMEMGCASLVNDALAVGRAQKQPDAGADGDVETENVHAS